MNLHRKLFGMLFAVGILLFIAWLCLQLIRGGGQLDVEELTRGPRDALDGLWKKLEGLIQPAVDAVKPKVDAFFQSIRDGAHS